MAAAHGACAQQHDGRRIGAADARRQPLVGRLQREVLAGERDRRLAVRVARLRRVGPHAADEEHVLNLRELPQLRRRVQRLRRVAERARRRRRAVVVVLVQPHLLVRRAHHLRRRGRRARGEAVERLEGEVDDVLDGAPALVRAADAAFEEEQRGRVGRAVRRRELRLAQRVHRAERHHVAQQPRRVREAGVGRAAAPELDQRQPVVVHVQREGLARERDREGLGVVGARGGEREGGEDSHAHFCVHSSLTHVVRRPGERSPQDARRALADIDAQCGADGAGDDSARRSSSAVGCERIVRAAPETSRERRSRHSREQRRRDFPRAEDGALRRTSVERAPADPRHSPRPSSSLLARAPRTASILCSSAPSRCPLTSPRRRLEQCWGGRCRREDDVGGGLCLDGSLPSWRIRRLRRRQLVRVDHLPEGRRVRLVARHRRNW